jgi:hypothetical protein
MHNSSSSISKLLDYPEPGGELHYRSAMRTPIATTTAPLEKAQRQELEGEGKAVAAAPTSPSTTFRSRKGSETQSPILSLKHKGDTRCVFHRYVTILSRLAS